MTTLNDTAAACAQGNADVPPRVAAEKLVELAADVEQVRNWMTEEAAAMAFDPASRPRADLARSVAHRLTLALKMVSA